MTHSDDNSLVAIYSSPVAADALVVQEMLTGEGIRATISESNGPFTGLLVAPSEVLVWKVDEPRARALIEKSEAHHS